MKSKYECPLCKNKKWIEEEIDLYVKLEFKNNVLSREIKHSKIPGNSLFTCECCGYMFMVRGKKCK